MCLESCVFMVGMTGRNLIVNFSNGVKGKLNGNLFNVIDIKWWDKRFIKIDSKMM